MIFGKIAIKLLQNSSTGSVYTPPDQSIPVKTPRTSTPSLKTLVPSHVDKTLDQSDTLTAGDKRGFDQRKGKALTLRTKKTDQQSQNCKKLKQNEKKLCDQTNMRDNRDDRKCVSNNKKSVPPLTVTENNIDNFLNQLNTKPRPAIIKYRTRSSVRQSQVSNDKKQNTRQENITHKKQPNISNNKTSIKQPSCPPVTPVVRLQQNKRSRMTEVPAAVSLAAFDFDDDDDKQPVSKKPRQVDSSASSANSSLEMSRLNASLLSRGNTSKSFSMTPQKKGRSSKSKRQSPNKRPVSR